MAATRLISMHLNKGKSIQQCLKDRTDYAQNPEKTDDGILVSSYECDPKLVEEQFALAKSEYLHNTGRHYHGDVIAYQIRQAFKPGEITPEEANRIGYETAMRWTKGQHAFIVATHIDKAHIHNHIIYNSTNLDCDRKFRDFHLSGIALHKVSDLVCLENGLSVITPRKPSERSRRTVYPERKSFRDEMRECIDICMEQKPKDMDELIKLLREMGYEVKRGKYVSLKGRGQKKFLRMRSLGAGYREQDLEKIFSGESTFTPDPKQQQKENFADKPESKVDMLLDIQAIIAKGKGPGYERWAKVHNIKQMAQTLLFLEEHDLRDYDELAEKAKAASDRFGEITEKQKALEARLVEIAALKKHIINYSKTRDVYAEYRKSGYSKKFFEEHREAITLCKAAKEAFSNIEGKLPKIKDLNQEYNEVLQEKKKTYAEYRQAKQDMKDIQMAKYNIDQFLKIEEQDRNAEKQKTTEQTL
ncbi:relaxase/mobilization nuclease domain-containing protein [Butyrivibrio sp. LC3010]|uniref:relaxase/mobilization nuclease domain-containing protein n=1 Tax=Butyrivibrio sp. LC3010 TaxID=1280680 RepID=UPI0003FEF526|nr:relaxase/mobilization nuclease domain-containing protein [Butyrivibrio sp. LC3010]